MNSQNISDLTGIEDFTSLTNLICYDNQLTNLDVSQNIALKYLEVQNMQLTSLDVSHNTSLEKLHCFNNPINSLDVSQNTVLNNLRCYSNQLTSLDVRNGNNTNFTYFAATNNPNLNCISVDDATWATVNWTNIDSHTSFSTNCDKTYVPDDNFEAYLESHDASGNVVSVGDANSMGDGIANNDSVTTANISGVTLLTVNSQNISDLTGIEDFIALTTLNCHINQLTNLDVTLNTALTFLNCQDNLLTSLNLTNNVSLINLYCNDNQLTNLDVSQNTSLENLNCHINQLSSLDLSQNTSLITLNSQLNPLGSLDI